MKKQLIAILILLSISGCQSKSDCFGGRLVIDKLDAIVKYEELKSPLFKDLNGKSYFVCNFPDTLIRNQNYKVSLKILKPSPTEKNDTMPCEIASLEIANEQKFEALGIGHSITFVGGQGRTSNDEVIVVGIDIEKITELEFEYEYTELINWKQKRQLKGKANLQKSNNDKIQIHHEDYESAFRFVDSSNGIDILVSKDFNLSEAKSRLIENKVSKISGLMHSK